MSPADYETREELLRRTSQAAPEQNGHAELDEHEKDVVRKANAKLADQEADALLRKKRQSNKPALKRRQADLRRAEPVRWLWQDRIPLEYLTLLVGQEGIGKGTLLPWIIARVTRGKQPGDLKDKRSRVAIVADEDDFDRVWVPRLHAARANLKRVEILEPPDDGYVTLSDPRLREAVAESGASFVYLDSLVDNLDSGVNDWHPKQLRTALRPAKTLAKDLGVAVLATLHTNKAGENARQLTPGSHQYQAVARGSIFLFPDPDEPERTLLVHEKSNHARRPNALTFRIEEYSFRRNGHTFTGPVAVDMQDGGELSASEAIAAIAQQQREERSPSKASDLRELISELLPHDGEWHPAEPVIAKCKAAGHAIRAITRARETLGIGWRREPGAKPPAPVQWTWPGTTDPVRTPAGGSRSGRSSRSGKSPANATTDTTATTDDLVHVRSGRRSAAGKSSKKGGRK